MTGAFTSLPAATSPAVPAVPAVADISLDGFVSWLVGAPVSILIVVVVAVIARWALHRAIRRVVLAATSRHATRLAALAGAGQAPALTGVASERHTQRMETVGALLRSITTFVVFGVAGLTILSILGIPLAPMLASAGVGGVALAFGAQSLVKDFLSGVFMIVEDQYGVGDVIDTGEVIGTVENVSLRVTQLRDSQGVTWYVRNGEVVRIGNKSQGWSTALLDVAIAYDENVDSATEIIRSVVTQLHSEAPWSEKLLEEPQVIGVESVGNGATTIRVVAKTVAQQQFGVQREMRERVKQALDAAGVRTPPLIPPYGPGPAK
ncbi:MAG: mechanosensitive ion channel family protein [Humibacillus sp.]|nr:mechanosensitive ion channel family protein [Humibacillus sp.]MDN5776946.1 mechanosensitive ion channel family protein [Humibacillus sp.]